ncbi:MAG TPA: toxin-antitoxin system YwqK family antitoxin [Bacteroidales bacterium]|nr:toxin-antitoxin system YwqK family antitoxin [Bacteroidales bacterium]
MFKKLTLLAALSLVTMVSWAQTGAGINQTDALGRKTGRWESRYPNGQLRYSGQFEQGRPIGEFRYYYESGELRAINTFSPGGLRAMNKTFAANGLLIAQGLYFDQQKDSTWRFYSDTDGSLVSEDEYADNVQHGISRTFYPNAEQVAEITNWREGKKHGPWQKFFPDGSLMAEGSFSDDQPDGPVVFYHPNGKVHIRGAYFHGLKVGLWETYDEDGILINKEEYKERGF